MTDASWYLCGDDALYAEDLTTHLYLGRTPNHWLTAVISARMVGSYEARSAS